MIVLKPTDTIKVVLAGAVSANQVKIVVSWVDIRDSDQAVTGIDGAVVFSNNTSAVTVIGSPDAAKHRVVKSIFVYNNDSATVTPTLYKDDGANTAPIMPVAAMLTKEFAEYSSND